MADILTRFAGPANAATATSAIFTVTAAHTATIRKIRFVNNTAAAITVKFGIGGTADANLILPAVSIPAGGLLNHDCFEPMTGGEVLHINVSATGGTYTISGLDQT